MPRGVDEIEIVGVIGAGTMGSGIAQVAAMNGFDVVMRDIEAGFLEAGFENIEHSLERFVSKEALSESDATAVRERIVGTVDLDDVADADFVIEAAAEELAVKREVFGRLDDVTDDDVVLATNTSTLSITAIAGATDREPLVIGMHFMNPAQIMEGLEVVIGERTDRETTAITHELAERLGKTTWESDDKPGFVVNRILMPWINEGIRVFDEGIAGPEDVDTGMKLGTSVPMGPLELADYIGLDIVLHATETLYDELGDRYKPAYLLKRKVDAGDLGRKTGRGFFEY